MREEKKEASSYYRVIHRGIVALALEGGARSEHTLTYGEVVQCVPESAELLCVLDVVSSPEPVNGDYYISTKLVEEIPTDVDAERGQWTYRVSASAPIPVLAGPMMDSPPTKALLLPGNQVEVSVRMNGFLRLSHRRGWILERQRLPTGQTIPLVQPEVDSDVISIASSSVRSTPNRRHRRPRRKDHSILLPPSAEDSFVSTPSKARHHRDASSVLTPTSNLSIMSDESSKFHISTAPQSPPPTTSSTEPAFFLFRVMAPRGLKVLDAPHFQVNHLIHGHDRPTSNHHTIFPRTSQKTRLLTRGTLFEACKREEKGLGSGGLIQLADKSGWAIVPTDLEEQFRNFPGERVCAYVEVGSARASGSQWCRVVTRAGVPIACAPPLFRTLKDSAPQSPDQPLPRTVSGGESDVASSVASSFLDSMFRTPTKRVVPHDPPPPPPRHDKTPVLACGVVVEVDPGEETTSEERFVRLKGGLGWIPLQTSNKVLCGRIHPPERRRGSFWFRVQAPRGIRVHRGPSKKASSIRSDDGSYFRFECGEFLRASESITLFSQDGSPIESFAKLYRNRHVQQYKEGGLECLIASAEWVLVYNEDHLFLEECAEEPRIERLKQGWRYNVIPDAGVTVRKGPSFASESTGVVLLGGESVLVNERVTPAGEELTWLRLKDGVGWVYDRDDQGQLILLAHSLQHRRKGRDDIAYNAIVARLFHNEHHPN